VTYFNRSPNPHKIGDSVKFNSKVVMSAVVDGKACVSEILRKGTVIQIIPYGGIDNLIIECYCVVDYGIFMIPHTLVEKCDKGRELTFKNWGSL